MSQAEAAAYLHGEFYLYRALTGRPAEPRGNAADHAVPHGVYPCRGDDRWLAIAVAGDEAFARFRSVVGWPDEPGWRTLGGRLPARAVIDARVSEWTSEREPEAAAEALQRAGVSAMAVQNPDDHRADPHLAARGAIVTVEHPEIGPERHAEDPLRLSRTPLTRTGPAPLFGADTESVLTGILGLDAAEVRRLVGDGTCR
jgi:benzylsuccinate CoA-transferase BbsF subunit